MTPYTYSAKRYPYSYTACGHAAMKLDILRRCGVIAGAQGKRGKELLVRIVAMVTRMTDHGADQVREKMAVYA